MTTLVDTSVLVRYLVDEPPEQGRRAAEVLESERPLAISTIALVETAFVLTRVYGVPRRHVVDALIGLLRRPNLSVAEITRGDAIEALLLCRDSGRVSFADALIWATARALPDPHVVTFDQRFPTLDVECELLAP